MPYWRLHYHLLWVTKYRMPLITPGVEAELHGYLIGKASAFGVIVHGVGGADDHIHLVTSIPPKISVSDFVGQLKGASAHHLNHLPGAPGNFSWQRGYGAFSVSPSGLDRVIEYVRNQKAHHRKGTVIKVLERVEDGSSPAVCG